MMLQAKTSIRTRAAGTPATKNSRRQIAPLLPHEVAAMVWRPTFERGQVIVRRDKFGGRRGVAHVPYAVESRLDRSGRPISVILTQIVDLKAEVYAMKRAARAAAA